MNASVVRVDTTPAAQAEEYAIFLDRIGHPESDAEFVGPLQSEVTGKTEVDALASALTPTATTLLAAQANPQDIEAAFNILLSLVHTSSNQATHLASLLAAFTAPTEGQERSALNLRLLTTVYNVLETSSPLRKDVFLAIVDVSSRTHHANLLLPQLPLLSARCQEWGCSPADEAAVLLALASALASAHPLEALSLRKDALVLRGSTDKDLATSTVLQAISTPGFFDLESLAALPALSALASSPAASLLSLLLSGDIPQYRSFAKENASALSALGFDTDLGLAKLRLLLLSTLGAQRPSQAIPYAEIASALDISEDEVEEWVIDLIQAGLADARMNQLDATVTVTRSTRRVFGKDEWTLLKERISSWDTSLSSVLSIISATRERAEAEAAAAAAPEVVEEAIAEEVVA